jgi:hypothetical protein
MPGAHDALTLMLLMALRDYPLDLVSGVLGAINPIGLARVTLLMANESALLLGHTGALVRAIMTSYIGYLLAGGITIAWIVIPSLLAGRAFLRRDF